jgi:acyl-CoA synthetase (AMP-forming)/AMP-acid ligase II/acyl carrier protein
MMQNGAFTGRSLPIPFSRIPDLLEHQAERIPDAPAILAPGRVPLTYGLLYQHVQKTARSLRALGVGRRDRVAIVLANGPELPVAILAVAASATCAPMNPAYQSDDVERYFADLRLNALITQAEIDSPARRVALSCGVRIIDLSPALDAEAGLFTLWGDHEDAAVDESVRPDHVAVLLTTSGTTSRPKVVPQTHANICAGAFGNVAALNLTENDRCLNVLPLFHGHGLDATVIASLAAGASVVCTPGLDTKQFCTWLTDFQPTWYSAVPTMHQAILAQATQIRERKADCRLRFVRSSAAPLPPRLFKELEQTFETPVIEFYSMAELAGAPIACNPLPPRRQKPGSVGTPVGLDVTIGDDDGDVLPFGQTGQIVVRGPGLISGYDGNPDATRDAFADGWFKTGDVGFFDEEGYLFLTGRSREMINRGGEKIAPRQVDEVLLEHPAVAEAATFAVPHPTLGEDVAAAVVLRPRTKVTPKDLRHFARARLAEFKIPREVLFVKEIPKGPTGKVQRVGLAARLGFGSGTGGSPAHVAPRTALEKALAEVWAEILHLEKIGIHDDFFALGGDSLMAARVLIRLSEIMHFEVELSSIFEAPTVAELAERIETSIHAAEPPQSPLAIDRMPRQNGIAAASFTQERIWELQNLLPELPFFNVLYVLRVTSSCDVAVLERSINEIVRRHDILRTTFTAIDGRCVQVIAPELIVPLRFDDLQELPPLKIEAAVHEFVREELSHSFVLEKSPLIRSHLVRLNKHSHLLLIAMAGIIEDGWSLGVLVNELAILYDAFSAGRASPLAPLPIQFADFADRERRWRSYPNTVAQLTYWEEQLRDPLPVMKLKLNRSRRKRITNDFSTAQRQMVLPAKLSVAAKNFSQREGVTLFMTVMATLKTLLYCYTGVDDLRVATDVANRNRPETEGLIGPIANTVVLRTNLGGDPSAREVLRRVRAVTLGALANQDIPFDAVVEALERDRAIDPAAVAQVKMSLQNSSLRAVSGSDHGLGLEEVVPGMALPLVTVTTFDVTLILRENAKGLVGTCVYKPHLFGAEAIERLLQDFQQVLERVVVQPERPISVIAASLNQRS